MFCSQCGKKVRENMLFCPFCGAEIVIPEQDEEAPEEPQPVEAAPVSEPKSVEAAPVSEPQPDSSGAPEEEPMDAEAFSASWRAEEPDWLKDDPDAWAPREPEIADIPDELPPPKPRPPVLAAERPPRVSGSALQRDVRSSGERHFGRGEPTALNGGGLFMEAEKPERPKDEYDRYDEYEDAYDREDEEDEIDAFEDEDRPGFLMRHLRSVVGGLLFLALAIIVLLYALSGPGQESLARANLAWRPEVYSRLGKASYESGEYNKAGLYYERALSRMPDKYAFASSAAKCYLDAGNDAKAAEMLKKCIALQPNTEAPYVYLLDLYPEAVDRPLEVPQLIEQGYRLTGSARLKLE